MNYPESQLILEEIKKAKKILVNCHRGPDGDSVGSALAIQSVIDNMGIKVDVICPNQLPADLLFLSNSNNVKTIDFNEFDFSGYDLFIILDSSTYGMVTGDEKIKKPDIKMIVIDHHFTNVGFGDINLIDSQVTSTAELLFKIFVDWKVKLNSDIATKLLTGILSDTGCFQYGGVGKPTFEIAGELLSLGASKDEIVFNTFRSVKFETLKFWGKVIENMQYDTNHSFVWSAIPLSVYKEYGEDSSSKEDVANLFSPVVKDTDFGLIMVEIDKDVLAISFRARSNFDVSKIAKDLGGGGHIAASGAKVKGPFDEAVEKVLTACRKYAKKN
ncbi:MAG: bifunctional oligoribonuclease/PAP phosphatase NrnA [Candidatus Woesebacteria bacterium]|nr:bifunctional oligoribonuclease/PAP phosphatase NrnA [Candidatus Woesebacteria bacterium]